MNTYLLTGGTGTLGSSVLQALLDQLDSHVYLLTRGDSDENAQSRTLDLLQRLMGARAASYAGRITAVRGDTERPLFGLTPARYHEMAGLCTHAIHCAGLVRMNLPIEAARQSAVAAADNLIRFTWALKESGQLQKVEFVSTVGIGGRLGTVSESRIDTERSFHNTYEQAKAEAETGVHAAIANGLPITVHRPSMIVGHSRTGFTPEFQIFYFLVEFLSGRRTKGLLPDFGAARLDIVPADFVAQAIVRSSLSQDTAGRVLHLCSGREQALPLRTLQNIVHETLTARGEQLPRPHYMSPRWFTFFVKALRPFVSQRSRAALDTLPIFLDYLETNQSFENVSTKAWCKKAGVSIPRTEEYLPRVLEFYFDAKSRSLAKDRSGLAVSRR